MSSGAFRATFEYRGDGTEERNLPRLNGDEKIKPVQPPVEDEQRQICLQYGSAFTPVLENEIVGFAMATRNQLPMNGLHHPPQNGTSGWYIWCGTELSDASDFFSPICVHHVAEAVPEVLKLLALSPGHRFLIDGHYTDVWFDQSLLETD